MFAAGLLPVTVAAQPGSVVAWGSYQNNVPKGQFVQIAAGSGLSAGVRPDGTLAAWGDETYPNILNVPSGRFLAVDVGGSSAGGEHSFGIGIREDHTLAAWGSNAFGVQAVPAGEFQTVSAGGAVAIAMRMDGTLTAWPQWQPIHDVPSGSFVAIAAGVDSGLALRADGSVVSWGNVVPPSIPPGPFRAIDAGDTSFFAIRMDGTIVGWGGNHFGVISNIPAGEFVSVKSGYGHAIAMRADGTLVRWGREGSGLLNLPSGSFSQIGAGSSHGVALIPAPHSLCLLVGLPLVMQRRRMAKA